MFYDDEIEIEEISEIVPEDEGNGYTGIIGLILAFLAAFTKKA